MTSEMVDKFSKRQTNDGTVDQFHYVFCFAQITQCKRKEDLSNE